MPFLFLKYFILMIIAIIVFDNSTNHDAISENGLNVTKWILILKKNSHKCIQHFLDQIIYHNQWFFHLIIHNIQMNLKVCNKF